MDNLLKQQSASFESSAPSQPRNIPPLPVVSIVLYSFTWLLTILAFVAGGLLLLYDLLWHNAPWLTHAPVSAAPLLLIGAASLAFQAVMRPSPLDLCKALLVSTAFILWGVDQLLPAGWFATTLGDIVIILYVIDLGWMISGALRAKARSAHS